MVLFCIWCNSNKIIAMCLFLCIQILTLDPLNKSSTGYTHSTDISHDSRVSAIEGHALDLDSHESF